MSTLDHLSHLSVKDILQMPIGDNVQEQVVINKDLLLLLNIDNDIIGDLDIDIAHIDNGFDCNITLNGITNVICSRCADAVKLPISYMTQSYYMFKPSDDEEPISSKHSIDIVGQCSDVIIQAIPSHSLCRPSCKGLCRQCGINLNNNPTHLDQYKSHNQLDNASQHITFRVK